MKLANPNVAVTLLMLAVLSIVIIYDVWAGTTHGPAWTVTDCITTWSRRWPLLSFQIGVIVGHLFACPPMDK